MTGSSDAPQASRISFESMRKLVTFLAVGGTFAIAYSLLCTLLVKALPGYPLPISIGVHAFLIPFAFFAQRIVTFASSGAISQEFVRYAGLQIGSISLSAFLLSRLVGQDYAINLIVFLSIPALAAIISFVVCHLYIFRTSETVSASTLTSAAKDGLQSRARNGQLINPLAAAMLFAAVLLIPAIQNGFPFVFSDTGVYLRAAVERFVPWERSVFYSIFGLVVHLQVSPWPIVAAQALVVAVLVRIFAIRILSVRSEAALIVTAILLSLASSLPWFAGELMPDIFTGALVLASLIIGFAWDRIANWERAFTFAVVSACITFHNSNALIAWGALLVFAVSWLFGWQAFGNFGARIRALVGAISLGTTVVVGTNAFVLERATVSPASSIFMLAKLLRDGPAFTVLEQNCPASGWALCSELGDLETYRDREKREPSLASVTDYFLWGGPLERLGWWKTFAPEAEVVVRKALLVSPLSIVEESAKDIFRQLTRFSVGDALLPYGESGEPVDSIRAVFGEVSASAYLASSQARRALPLNAVNALQTALVLASLCILTCGGIYCRHRDPTILHLTLALYSLILLNAAVTATFSSVHDRYQSRVIWLLPMLASLIVARWLTLGAIPKPHLAFRESE